MKLLLHCNPLVQFIVICRFASEHNAWCKLQHVHRDMVILCLTILTTLIWALQTFLEHEDVHWLGE